MSMEMPSAQASWIHTVDFSEEKYVYIQVHIDYPTVYWCIILSFLTTFDPLKSMKSMLDLIDSPH